MKKIYLIIVCSAVLLALSGCPYNGPDPEYKLEMYISLNLAGNYPAEHPVADLADLAEFGGKNVIFSVEGLDYGINHTINIEQTSAFGWTGGDINTSTQYAVTEIDLTENTMYLAGRYKFRMFIDWDGSGNLTSGDLVFNSYSLLADKDSDPETGSISVSTDEYGTFIVYNSEDYSLTVDDPLSEDEGFTWVITSIHEGAMAVY